MKVMISALIAMLTMLPAHAANGRWTLGYGMGTTEAIVENANGASVNIYCPSGQADHTPGIIIETNTVHPRADERVDLQFIVDGRVEPLSFDEIEFKASDPAKMNALRGLIDTLAHAKSPTFSIRFLNVGSADTFSLAGAKEALGSAKEFLDGCE